MASVTHVLDKNNYASHHLVTLPNSSKPLAPSSLRLKTKIIGLTTNNLSYARMGHLVGWWDTYPLPADGIPEPYNDKSKYGRISAWGWAEVVESTAPGIEVGASLYGYLNISTEEWTVQIEQTGIKDQILVVDPYRQHLWKIYNRYAVVHASLAELEKSEGKDSLGWDGLAWPLYTTSYSMNVYSFAWKDENRVHPSGDEAGKWTAEDANLDDAAVVVLNASGKTGMAWAYTLRNDRPKEHQPKAIIGVGSEASKGLIESSGFYDKVLLNSEAEAFVKDPVVSQARRVVLFEFGARPGALKAWIIALSSAGIAFTIIGLGGEVKAVSQAEVMKMLTQKPSGWIQGNANVMREKGIAVEGEKYFEQFNTAWAQFKAKGGIPGLHLEWHEGLEEWEKGWDALCKDKVPATTGLVYKL
ncbi:hypothetical protein DM02DRAFT_616325 [Periconia macrospinosa]|uniref:Uncharacterized protein n=1 Tax=Periconia macrospinosa TaxID=97972 RepID=A0A2V1DKB1_9PLEO|nr:hypothetical protein DM02DRAFT_616325 [Periconia macrospinosa]